jgi:hypothetical protein
VEQATVDSEQAIISEAMEKSQKILVELDEVIRDRILKPGHARRLAWLINKRRVKFLQNELGYSQDTIIAALSVELVSVSRQ